MFSNCTSLSSIIIPKSIVEIDSSAFSGCTALKEIIFEGNAPQVLSNGSSAHEFNNVENATVYYYEGATGFTTPTWMNLNCQIRKESDDQPATDNQPTDDTETPSGDILDIGELPKEEQDKVKNKVLTVLNVESLRNDQAIHFYDITLKNNVTGEIYTKENFPNEGVTVTIPYPAGINKNSHAFHLFHFANGADGEGTKVEITLTDDGIQFHVYSLSPLVLITEEKKSTTGVNSPKTGDDSTSIWLMASMPVAGAGSILIINKKATRE